MTETSNGTSAESSTQTSKQKVNEILNTLPSNELAAVPMVIDILKQMDIKHPRSTEFLSVLGYCVQLMAGGAEQ